MQTFPCPLIGQTEHRSHEDGNSTLCEGKILTIPDPAIAFLVVILIIMILFSQLSHAASSPQLGGRQTSMDAEGDSK